MFNAIMIYYAPLLNQPNENSSPFDFDFSSVSSAVVKLTLSVSSY